MTFALNPGRPVPGELARVAAEQIQLARTLLRTRAPDLHEAVHDARRAIRRTRASLILARPTLPPEVYEAAVAPLRDAGRRLSRMRDSQSVLEGLAKVPPGAIFSPAARARIGSVLARRRDTLARRVGPDLRVADRRLAAALAASPRWFLQMEQREVWTGLRYGYARAARAARRIGTDADDESMHRLRQRARAHSLQLELLREYWPVVIAAQAGEAKRLAQMLGSERDLLLLQQRLRRLRNPLAADCPTQAALGGLDERRRLARTAAFDLARLVFAEPQRSLAGRIAAYRTALGA